MYAHFQSLLRHRRVRWAVWALLPLLLVFFSPSAARLVGGQEIAQPTPMRAAPSATPRTLPSTTLRATATPTHPPATATWTPFPTATPTATSLSTATVLPTVTSTAPAESPLAAPAAALTAMGEVTAEITAGVTPVPLPPGLFGPRIAPSGGLAALIAATLPLSASSELSSTAALAPTPDGWVLLPTATPTLPVPQEAAGAIAEIGKQTPGETGIEIAEGTAEITPSLPITEALQQPVNPAPTDPVPAEPTPVPPAPVPTTSVAPTPDGAARSARVPILMYHYLGVPPPDADRYRIDLSVAPDTFAAHLDAMQQAGYTPISFYTLLAYLNQGAPLPEKPVIITFDDGYRDNYENAFPLLRARGMIATFFVVTDFIDEERPEYLTWDMLREMYAAGMSIESHGRNHVSLKNKDRDYLIWQALGSSETIQFELGVRPLIVSYPAGEYDDLTIEVFRSAGYWAGVTTVQGATHHGDDLFRLQRVRIRNSTSTDELLHLLALDW